MLSGEADEALYGGAGAGQAVHGGDGVGLTLQALAVTPLRSEMVKRPSGRTSGVVAEPVGAKDKDLAGLQGADVVGSYAVIHIGCYWGNCHKDMGFCVIGGCPFGTL